MVEANIVEKWRLNLLLISGAGGKTFSMGKVTSGSVHLYIVNDINRRKFTLYVTLLAASPVPKYNEKCRITCCNESIFQLELLMLLNTLFF